MKYIKTFLIGIFLCSCNNNMYESIMIIYDDPYKLYIREPFATDMVHRYNEDPSTFNEMNIYDRRIIKDFTARMNATREIEPLRYFETPFKSIKNNIVFDGDTVVMKHYDHKKDINARIMVVAYGNSNDTIFYHTINISLFD